MPPSAVAASVAGRPGAARTRATLGAAGAAGVNGLTRLNATGSAPVVLGMPRRCDICGGTCFIPSEYRAFGQLAGARAIECAECDALVLDEAMSARTSPRLGTAIRSALAAARASVPWVDEAPTTQMAWI